METKNPYIRPEILVEEWKFWKKTNRGGRYRKAGIYEVSNFGRGRFNGELIDFSTQKSRYYKFGGRYVHRIVAELFIPNPENKPCVDHIDTNKHNNVYWNLRWCTQTENNNNPLTRKHFSESQKGKSLSNETKQKMSDTLKIVLNKPEVKQKKSDSLKIYYNNNIEVRQKKSESMKDRPWINNGNERKRVKKDQLNDYLNNGWNLGRGKNKKIEI